MCNWKIKVILYKFGVGSFMYAMVGTWLELAFAVSMVNQFISKVSPSYWMTMKHVMKYLKGIVDFELCLGKILRY